MEKESADQHLQQRICAPIGLQGGHCMEPTSHLMRCSSQLNPNPCAHAQGAKACLPRLFALMRPDGFCIGGPRFQPLQIQPARGAYWQQPYTCHLTLTAQQHANNLKIGGNVPHPMVPNDGLHKFALPQRCSFSYLTISTLHRDLSSLVLTFQAGISFIQLPA